MRSDENWHKDASGNPKKRKLIKEMNEENNQAEAIRFQAQMDGKIPRVRADWALSQFFHSKNSDGGFNISRIRFLLPFAVSETVGNRLVERFQDVFEEIVYEKKERRR